METMVGITILMIIGTALVSLVLTVISANTTAKLRHQGVTLAEEAIEQSKGYVQVNNFQGLSTKANGNPCYPDGTFSGSTITCPTSPNYCVYGQVAAYPTFYRAVQLTNGASQVRVQAIVGWNDRGSCASTEVDTYYYNY